MTRLRKGKVTEEQIYPKPIVIYPFGGIYASQERIAGSFGLSTKDFIWVSTVVPLRLKGRSRSTLVLDPYDITHDVEREGFANIVKARFDNIATSVMCAKVLAKWAKEKNFELYLRMVEAGVCDGVNAQARQSAVAAVSQDR